MPRTVYEERLRQQQYPYQEHEVDRIFRELGIHTGGAQQATGFGTGVGTRGFGTMDIPAPTGRMVPYPFRGMTEGDPKYLDDTGGGFFEQLREGFISPYTDTMSMLGAREPRDMPSNTAGVAGNIMGSIIGWTAVGLVTKGLGLAPLAAKLGTGAAAAGSKVIPAATRGLIGPQVAGTMGKGMLYGGLSQAHWAAGQQMPLEEIPKEALVGAATGGVLGGAMGAVGHRLTKRQDRLGQLVRRYGERAPDRQPGDRDPGLMIHPEDPHSVAQAHRALGDVYRARDITEFMNIQNMQKAHPLPSTKFLGDTGVNVYRNQFFNTTEDLQTKLLDNALKRNVQDETMLSPWLSKGMANEQAGKGRIAFKRYAQGEEGRIFKMAVDETQVKRTGVNKARGLTKEMDDMFNVYDNATTFREREQIAFKLQKKVGREITKKKAGRHFRQLSFEEQSDIADWERMLYDMWWEMDNHVDLIVQGSPEIPLPSHNAIKHPEWSKLVKERIAQDANPDQVVYDPRVDDFLNELNAQKGMSYVPNLERAASADFLPDDVMSWKGVQRPVKQVWREIVDEVGPDNLAAFDHPYARIPLDERIPEGDLSKWFKQLNKLPDRTFMEAISLDEYLKLREPVGIFARYLAPGRKILGEYPMRVLRDAEQKFKRDFLEPYSKKIREISETIGAHSERARKSYEYGGKLTELVEGDLVGGVDASPIDRDLRTAARDMFSAARTVAPDVPAPDLSWRVFDLEGTAKRMGVTTDTLSNILYDKRTGVLSKFGRDAHGNMTDIHRQVIQMAKKQKITTDEILTDMVYKRVRDHRLHEVVNAGGERLTREARELWNTTPRMLRGAKQARDLYDEFFQISGLDPDMYRAGYLPHFKRASDMGAHRARYSTLDKQWEEIGLSQDERSAIFWMNEMHREDMLANYNPNFFEITERYMRGLGKKKHYEPALQHIDAHYKAAKLDPTRDQIWDDMKRYIKGVPGDFEKHTDQMIAGIGKFLGMQDAGNWPRPTAAVGSFLAELQYSAGMGWNPWMPLRNLTQKLLGVTSITDSGNPLEGFYWIAKAKHQKATGKGLVPYIGQHNKVLNHRIVGEGLEYQMSSWQRVSQQFGLNDTWANRIGKAQDRSMNWFRLSDKSNVEDVFNARALYLIEEKGANFADAIELATSTTMATQFMYGIDSPMLYKTPVGKQIGIFQSWPLNWAQLMWEQGTRGQMQQAAGTIVAMAAASEILSTTGISLRSIHPVETARGILPYAMMEGEMQFPAALRTGFAGLDYMRSIAEGDEEAIDQALRNLRVGAEGLMPFGVVTSRTLQFLDRLRHGWKDFEDPGFMNYRALAPQTREDTSRLRHDIGPVEGTLGLLAGTERARQRQDDWQFVSRQMSEYRRLRSEAIENFIAGDMDKFMDKQERLVLNFGQWIEPQDIHQEMELMTQSARERQLRGFPEEARNPYLEQLEERYARGY